MSTVVTTLIIFGAFLLGASIYIFKKSKPTRVQKDYTEAELTYKLELYRSSYGKRKDAQGFLDEILQDDQSAGGVGAVTARMASGDFAGAAVVGLASAATKTIVDGGMRFFRKKKIESPKSEKQEKIESKIIELVYAYNDIHHTVERMNRKATFIFTASIVLFFFAAVIHTHNTI